MIRLSKAETRALVRVLADAEEHTRERAVYDAMRARAMKSIGEKLLTQAHENYAAAAIATAGQLLDWREHLEAAVAASITTSRRPQLGRD